MNFFHHHQLIIFILFYGGFKFVSSGPSKWLTKLTPEELQKYLTNCNYGDIKKETKREISLANTQKKKLKHFEYFIKNGEARNSGELKFAAVLVNPMNNWTYCGASFITPRHLLTARHCFIGFAEKNPNLRLVLKAGGVCYSNRLNECSKLDMQDIPYKFAIFASNFLRPREKQFDVAIIELDNNFNFPADLLIEHTCLPLDNQEIPKQILTTGWGRVTESLKEPAARLRSATLTIPEVFTYFRRRCQEYKDLNNIQCAFPSTKEEPESAYHSDSGSPIVGVEVEQSSNLYTQYGIVIGGSYYNDDVEKPMATYFLDLRKYLKDFCYYLNLCLPNIKTNERFLLLDSVYLKETRANLPSVSLFNLIGENENNEIQKSCDFISPLEAPPFNEATDPKPLPKQLNFNWGAIIMNNSTRQILCSATFITSIHLVTIKDCIRQAILEKGENTDLIVVGDGFCLTKGKLCQEKDVKEFKIHLIGWDRFGELQEDLAIIQLMPHQIPIIPACFIEVPKENITQRLLTYSYLEPVEGRVKYSYLPQATSSLYCSIPFLLCLNSPSNFAINPADRGAAVLETKNGGKVIGILLSGKTQQKTGLYLNLRKYYKFLCVYLNRCDSQNGPLLLYHLSDFDEYYNVQERKFITDF